MVPRGLQGSCRCVESDAGDMLICHDFDDCVADAVAKGATKWVCRVRRRRTVQHDWSSASFQLLADSVPFRVGSDLEIYFLINFISLIKYTSSLINPHSQGEGAMWYDESVFLLHSIHTGFFFFIIITITFNQ